MRLIGVFLTVLLSFPVCAAAAEQTLWELGLRGGGDATGVNESYTAAEAYLLRELPWEMALGKGAQLRARIDMGLGYLESNDDEGGWLAIGGDLVLGLFDGALELEAGFRPTYLNDHEYGDDDFGGAMQLSSHAGVAVVFRSVTFSYRYQHMSNAGIYDENPGLDLHLAGLGVRF